MSNSTTRGSARLRTALFTSAAIASMVIAGAAHAQTTPGAPTGDYLEAQGDTPTGIYLEAQGDKASITSVAPDPQIVIANPNTPTTDRDPVNITGVGQMIVDTQDGFIGLCTGTLINPRTVIFAAHCVNESPATLYGAGSGGRPIAFGFSNSNNTAGASAFGQYLNGALKNQTNAALWLYNVNQVRYNPLSTEPDAAGFLYGDIAMASLDTPTRNIPTWALLFSALPATNLGASGTGYHVVLDGYGNNGTGTSGSNGGIDYRRRLAENMLGGLASLDEFENFLFGGAANANPQNLYWIDFDDPRRFTGGASGFDFNAWRDNAVANGKEGITASGDSGGPLILDNTYAKMVVIGVLSGGYTRFFNGQPANGYGTASFYQPLYLYWDWIAANNPYHYVSAVAGDGNWTDPLHWVTNIDPNYQIIGPGNVLVNGVPTSLGAGNTDQPGFGQACFQSGNVSDCLDIATGTETVDGPNPAHPIGTGGDGSAVGDAANDRGSVSTTTLADGSASAQAIGDGAGTQTGTSTVTTLALPPATLANGLPGATNFVPNNVDPVRLTGAIGKYFDVTLTATGRTTLSSAVTVDRFAIGVGGGGAILDVTSTGSLTSLIDITQATGTMQVNGLVSTLGDYLMVSGGLNGTGTIKSAFFTNVTGVIAPGTSTTIGNLNFQSNLILASGSIYLLNVGASGTSDKIVVTANGTSTGMANVGGVVVISPVAGYTIRSNDTFTILTSTGGVTGTFSPLTLSAILSQSFTYTTNAITVKVVAGTYASVVSSTSPVQVAYAQLLDQNRGTNYTPLADIYGPLDLQNAATIRATLDALAPRTETLKNAVGGVMTDNMGRFYNERISGLGNGNANGTVAMIGQPMNVMANATMGNVGAMGSMNLDGDTPVTTAAKLPSDMSGYLAGGYLTGDSAPMPTALPSLGRDTFDGYYIAAGLEKDFSPNASAGLGISYSSVKGITPNAQEARAKLYQATLYGKIVGADKVAIDGQLSVGWVNLTTRRTATILATTYTLTSADRSLAFGAEVGVSRLFDVGKTVNVGPRVALRYSTVSYDDVSEAGGPPALTIDREPVKSIESRLGLEVNGSGKVRPYLSAYWIHDFDTNAGTVGANFVGGVGPNVPFSIAAKDKNWAEVSGGLSIDTGSVSLGVSADTTIGRADVANQSYRGTIKFRF
jgi:hypothetical protein